MHDPNTVVVKKSLKITVSHKVVKTNLSFLQPYFTEIEPYYTNSRPNPHKGVVSYYGLNDLLKRLNTYISNNKKFDAPAILKGTYKGGTSGQYCKSSAPFLFFDVDVKGEENKQLQDSFKNAEVFEQLQKIALCVWRSNSQKGIAGILYVPQLKEVTKAKTSKHLIIGNAITTYLSSILKQQGLKVKFDKAQNKFRQVRSLAEQKELRKLNTVPYTFAYEIDEVEAKTYNGFKQYQFESPRAIRGSIREQFNSNNPIDSIILNCGFEKVPGANRYKHFNTTSSSSGSTDPSLNLFYNHSSSFSNKKCFDPFSLVLYTQYDNDYKAFLDTLRKQNYKEKRPEKKIVTDGLKQLKNPNITHKEVFAALYDLRNLPLAEKLNIIKENCRTLKDRQLYCSYLKCKDLIISYDTYFKIDNYVSEVLPDVLTIAEETKKVVLRAETGTGKTTAFLRDFLKHRPDKRCLILAPLTTIVDQSISDYKNIIGLTGKSQPLDHTRSKTASIVVATYEQGTKHLASNNNFDFIVIDEVHNLFLAHDYKSETISQLTALLEYKVVIGLTGTPNNLFQNLGYSLLSISKRMQKPVQIVQRVDNRNAAKIILQHLDNAKGKCIFRINSTQTLQGVKAQLIKEKRYEENEILILYSSQRIKKSYDYSQVVKTSSFSESVKVVLTTGLIDEGINLKQLGFTDVVFIEGNYAPNPEPLKQFFARFRIEEDTRTNYHYYKKRKDQEVKYWNKKRDYTKKLELLISNDISDFNSYKDVTNDNKFYYGNRKINEYYLGFEVSTIFFESFNQQEFNYYLNTNFNVNIIVDETYRKGCIDISEITTSAKNTKAKVYDMLLNNWVEVEAAVRKITTNKELQKQIEDIGQPLDDKTLNFVQENIKVFERFTKYHHQLFNAGVNDPMEYLLDGGKLIDARKYKLNLTIIETINLINNPKSKSDMKRKIKLENFFKVIDSQKHLDKRKMFQLWKKLRIVSKASNQNVYLIGLIEKFTKWNYDTNNKRFYL